LGRAARRLNKPARSQVSHDEKFDRSHDQKRLGMERQKAESGENPHRTNRRGFRRRDADGCDRDGRAPRLGNRGSEREKRGRFQLSHGERFDKSHGQKGLGVERQKAEGRKRGNPPQNETKGIPSARRRRVRPQRSRSRIGEHGARNGRNWGVFEFLTVRDFISGTTRRACGRRKK